MNIDEMISFRPVGVAIIREVLLEKGFAATTENIKRFKEANKESRFPNVDTKQLTVLVEGVSQTNYKRDNEVAIKALFARKREIEVVERIKLVIPPDLEKEEALS